MMRGGQMSGGQVWGGAFMIAAGIAGLLGSQIGWGVIWPIYPMTIGLLMIFVPKFGEENRKRRAARQIAGSWMLLTGLIFIVARFIGYGAVGPLFMVGGGLILMFRELRVVVGGGRHE